MATSPFETRDVRVRVGLGFDRGTPPMHHDRVREVREIPRAWRVLGFFAAGLCESLHKPCRTAWIERRAATMSTEFTPIFLFVLVAGGCALSIISASAIRGPSKVAAGKQIPSESGMNPFGDARQRFDVRYYLIAI